MIAFIIGVFVGGIFGVFSMALIKSGCRYDKEGKIKSDDSFQQFLNFFYVIGDYAFRLCTNLKDVYYSGTEEEWKKIDIRDSNDSLSNVKIHFNSKTEENTTKPTTSTTNSKLLGDINGDSKIDSKDAVIILKYYAATLTGFTGTISEFNK